MIFSDIENGIFDDIMCSGFYDGMCRDDDKYYEEEQRKTLEHLIGNNVDFYNLVMKENSTDQMWEVYNEELSGARI